MLLRNIKNYLAAWLVHRIGAGADAAGIPPPEGPSGAAGIHRRAGSEPGPAGRGFQARGSRRAPAGAG